MPGSLYAGAMCGTSLDGIDLVLVTDQGGIHSTSHTAFEPTIQARLSTMQRDSALARSSITHAALSRDVAVTVAKALQEHLQRLDVATEEVRALGWLGITVFYQPPIDGGVELILVGDAGELASRAGVPVVAGVREGDIANGGAGAPLCGAFHEASGMLSPRSAVLNLGGIANITLPNLAFDVGPGNTLLDLVSRTQFQRPYDGGGAIAASGTRIQPLLASMLGDPYFAREAPKTTGVEYFSAAWLDEHLRRAAAREASPHDLLATLVELTAATCAQALPASIDRLLVCGGGASNASIMGRLATRCHPVKVAPTDIAGYPADAVEAMCVAWYARQFCEDQTVDLRAATGSSHVTTLGKLYQP